MGMTFRVRKHGSSHAGYAGTNSANAQVTYPAVCGKRATFLGNGDSNKRMSGTGRPAGLLRGQLFGPGGNTTPEYWIDGRRVRAAAKAPQWKRPCRPERLPVDP
jgi:hypothetical protein